jgi:hypothetical protein
MVIYEEAEGSRDYDFRILTARHWATGRCAASFTLSKKQSLDK